MLEILCRMVETQQQTELLRNRIIDGNGKSHTETIISWEHFGYSEIVSYYILRNCQSTGCRTMDYRDLPNYQRCQKCRASDYEGAKNSGEESTGKIYQFGDERFIIKETSTPLEKCQKIVCKHFKKLVHTQKESSYASRQCLLCGSKEYLVRNRLKNKLTDRVQG